MRSLGEVWAKAVVYVRSLVLHTYVPWSTYTLDVFFVVFWGGSVGIVVNS